MIADDMMAVDGCGEVELGAVAPVGGCRQPDRGQCGRDLGRLLLDRGALRDAIMHNGDCSMRSEPAAFANARFADCRVVVVVSHRDSDFADETFFAPVQEHFTL
jgi:hypothetical protein